MLPADDVSPETLFAGGNVVLQTRIRCADPIGEMNHLGSRDPSPTLAARPLEGQPSLRELAHELNSLLDGSMRSVRLAERAIESEKVVQAGEVLTRLRTALEAMGDMTTLLKRALSEDTGSSVFVSGRSLQEEAEAVVARLAPLAEMAGIEVVLSIAPEAGRAPTGPLGTILANGLRNAIEACARSGARGRVEVAIAIDPAASALVIEITDDGPGPEASAKPHGHGVGLGVCRRIAGELGGKLWLTGASRGGAVLRVIVPFPKGAR
jgi:signal transduction histidine kinase